MVGDAEGVDASAHPVGGPAFCRPSLYRRQFEVVAGRPSVAVGILVPIQAGQGRNSIMRGLFVIAVLLVIGVVALGYYRDWFKVTTANDSKAVNVNVTVDKEKVKADEEKAKQKLKEVGGEIKDKAKGLTDKVKGDGEKKPGDQP
jgi:hypothetical protein